jgi:hypothetical protein
VVDVALTFDEMDIPVMYILSVAVSESLINTLAWLLLATLLTLHRELAAKTLLGNDILPPVVGPVME